MLVFPRLAVAGLSPLGFGLGCLCVGPPTAERFREALNAVLECPDEADRVGVAPVVRQVAPRAVDLGEPDLDLVVVEPRVGPCDDGQSADRADREADTGAPAHPGHQRYPALEPSHPPLLAADRTGPRLAGQGAADEVVE